MRTISANAWHVHEAVKVVGGAPGVPGLAIPKLVLKAQIGRGGAELGRGEKATF